MQRNYYKKSHQHKPKKGKGSYDREIDWPDLIFPPVNLNTLQSAYNFYSEEDDDEDKDS